MDVWKGNRRSRQRMKKGVQGDQVCKENREEGEEKWECGRGTERLCQYGCQTSMDRALEES